MGCTLSKVSDNTGTETNTGQKVRRGGLLHWIGKRRQTFLRLVRSSQVTTPQTEAREEPPNDIFQKPHLRRRGRQEAPETLNQNEKKAIQRRHLKGVVSTSQEKTTHDVSTACRRHDKGLDDKKQSQVHDKHQKEVSSSDVSEVDAREEDSNDDAESVCQLDATPEGCEWCEVIRKADRLAVLRRKAKYKREQKAKIAAEEEGWDSEEELRAYLEGDEWQEKRRRIEEWVEDGIREMKAKELRKMMKKLKGAVKQKQDEVEGGMKMDLEEQSAYLEEMVSRQENILEPETKTEKPHPFLELEERLKEEERQREEIKKKYSAKMERYFAARLEMRMQAVSERVGAEEERRREKVLERCKQRRMEEKRRKEEEEEKEKEKMKAQKKTEMHAPKEAEGKTKTGEGPPKRVSFDFQDSVDELTRRKVKKTACPDSRQKDLEKIKVKRGHTNPMEELDDAIKEILAKEDSKPSTRHPLLRAKHTAVPRNTPTMHGIARSVASRYQGGEHFPATSSSSHTAVDRGCPPTAQLNQMTSQRRRLPRPNAAYGDRPYPPTTGRIPDSAREFFQRQLRH